MKGVVLFVCLSVAIADDLDERTRQFTNFQVDGGGIDIESGVKDDPSDNKWRLQLNSGGSLTGEVDLHSKSADSQIALEYRWVILGIQEYVENSASQDGFSAGDQAGFLWSTNQNFVFSSLPDEVVNNVTVHNFEARSQDNVLSVIGHISTQSFTLNGTVVAPVQAKFDFVIDTTQSGWTWRLGATSELAMLARLKTKTKVRGIEGTQGGGTKVLFGADAASTGYFSWAPTVTINGGPATANVVVSNFTKNDGDSGDDDWSIAYSFIAPRPTRIEWDPLVSWSPSGAVQHLPSAVFALLMIVQVPLIGSFMY